ncbi:hypothetical protein SAMN05428961_1021043 [Paenibacillus sp. OK060]|nr:hypothetical protein SAMN05428961_1021043 [Paenibacillus sp. OK060]
MVLEQNVLKTEKDFASNSMRSLFGVVYLDEEPGQYTVVLPSRIAQVYRSSPLKDTPSTFTLTSTTRNPVMVSTASLTFCWSMRETS